MLVQPSAQESKLFILTKLKVDAIIPISQMWGLRVRKAKHLAHGLSLHWTTLPLLMSASRTVATVTSKPWKSFV